MTEHTVYVVGQKDGAKKIGLAKDVNNRRNYIQCAAPFKVDILATWVFPNLKDVKWLATEDGSEGKGTGRHIACFILEPEAESDAKQS